MSTQQEHLALLVEAEGLANAVPDHAHFGEMVGALRHAEHALTHGEMDLPEGVTLEAALERLRRGRLIIALAMELWTEQRT